MNVDVFQSKVAKFDVILWGFYYKLPLKLISQNMRAFFVLINIIARLAAAEQSEFQTY